MKINISKTDRSVRILIALVFILLNLSGVVDFPACILTWVFVVIFILTALTGHCPVYTLFGINTHTRKKEFKQHH
jgi:uncharacterized integral membrane protein